MRYIFLNIVSDEVFVMIAVIIPSGILKTIFIQIYYYSDFKVSFLCYFFQTRGICGRLQVLQYTRCGVSVKPYTEKVTKSANLSPLRIGEMQRFTLYYNTTLITCKSEFIGNVFKIR